MKTELFINKSIAKHGCKYDYSKVEYISWNSKVIIICKEHGDFLQNPNNHLNGQGCYKCGILNRTQSVNNFIKKSILKHNSKYDYSKVNYLNAHTKVILICKEHGEFLQTPNSHLKGSNCPKCFNNSKIYETKEFIKRSLIKHSDRYDYSKVKFIDNYSKIIIVCDKHGEFIQLPINHLSGSGCKKCSIKYCKKENMWLDSINIVNRQVRIDGYIVDGYDLDTNTIYEFNGDFWHGNPKLYNRNDINVISKKTFGELYQKTIDKENRLKKLGYNFISIWESDFK